ncbi:MAG: hypothetical protein AMXMBFR84_03790 [Candidatus Hydrogenedentota bacterium]
MPCSDVTEIIQVTIDENDRLKDYFFSKRTCGQGVGAGNLLLAFMSNWSIDEILRADAEHVIDHYPFSDDIDTELEEFLVLKHFFAVQSVLEVLTGRDAGGKESSCAAAEIAYEANGDIIITGQIDVDLVTEKIKACGNCKGCGKSKKEKVVFH